ncbi:hypothetical protein GCM10025788_02380 [Serinicoccus chungangensis]
MATQIQIQLFEAAARVGETSDPTRSPRTLFLKHRFLRRQLLGQVGVRRSQVGDLGGQFGEVLNLYAADPRGGGELAL